MVGLFNWGFTSLQHCTGHITTGSWKGRGNQYIEFARVVYCKLPTNGKQLPAFPLEPVLGSNPGLRGGRRECYHSATVAPRFLVGILVRGYRRAMSYCDLSLTFDLNSVKMFSILIFETYFCYDNDIWIAAADYYLPEVLFL